MQGPQKSLAKERSSAELRFASSLALLWVWRVRRHGSAMNAYGALDPGLATRSLSCALFRLISPKKVLTTPTLSYMGLEELAGTSPHQAA